MESINCCIMGNMNNYEIENILISNKNFLGCYASDQLHTLPTSLSKSFIINTANSDSDGEHWVALVLQEKRCFYFDSFGLPIINKNILHFLHTYQKVMYSDICIQDTNSEQCGKFYITFIKYVHSKKSYNDFILTLDFVKLYKNDEI